MRFPTKLASLLGSVALSGSALLACGEAMTSSSEMANGGPEGRNPSYASSDAGVAAPGMGTEATSDLYGKLVENDWVDTAQQPTSTFGIDVDTASYTIARRDLARGALPVPDGVRVEEYVNYFRYAYPQPQDDKPFAVHLEAAPSMFGQGLHLLRVGVQGRTIDPSQRKRANLVFLVDVSGSMGAANKLPLVQYTLKRLVEKLQPTDTLGIVTYAGAEKVLLAPTAVTDKAKIIAGIDGLTSGGGTNGEGGIRKAYQLAEQVKLQQQQESINRVILCTDGDFNVGLTGDALVALIEQERAKGITLSTFGYGLGNYNDRDMERLADKGDGNYAYVDTQEEADRIVQKRLVATLQLIAKDTKIQIDLDPTFVQRYRLVGYENRVLNNEDFADDAKDSGDLGAGHSVTAFYEVELTPAAKAGELAQGNVATVKMRWKAPEGTTSTEAAWPLLGGALAPTFAAATPEFRFAAATTEFAEILRHSKHSEGARFDDVLGVLQSTAGSDPDRAELLTLVTKAKSLWK